MATGGPPLGRGRVYGTLSNERLRALLDADRARNSVSTSRSGKINRSHYAKVLGCVPSALTRFNAVFVEYERELGIVTGPMRHSAEMRGWLTAAYESGDLDIRNGRLDRSVFSARFGLRGGSVLKRHPEICALLEEFDARAKRENYLPAAMREELDRVRAALAKGQILNKDRMSISLVDLAKAADVQPRRLRDRQFAPTLAVVQAEITAAVRASKINPYINGRVFPFSDLVSHWPRSFLERVGVRFRQVSSSWAPGTVRPIYQRLANALHWIGHSSDQHCRAVIAEAAEHGRVLSNDAWEDALLAYRDHLLQGIANGTASDRGVDAIIGALRVGLDGLATGQIVPAKDIPLPSVKYARRRASHLLSVAEASTRDNDGHRLDYVEFARDRFLKACKALGSEMGSDNSEVFFTGLAAELAAKGHLPTDPSTAIRLVLEQRLNALKTRAVAIVDEARQLHDRGRVLLLDARIDSAQFEENLLDGSLDTHGRKQMVRRLFPDPNLSSADEVEVGLSNLLALIEQQYAGIPPLGLNCHVSDNAQFFARRYSAYGGIKIVNAMLNPEADAVGAVLTLYLLESGANVSVGRTLDRGCLEVSDLDEHRRITGHKARARGKPIIVDLPDSSPAVSAIEWLLSAGSRLASNAEKDSDRLFLMRMDGRVQLVTPQWYRSWFKTFAASTPGLERVRLVPSMIRPSVLLQAALSNDGRLAVGAAIGQHGVDVSQGYQNKWSTRLLYDENIRRFLVALETLVMSNVEDAASMLGITVQQFEARLGDLRPTGLGTFCRDQRGRPGEKSGSCSAIDCWNDCPHLLIVAEVNAIAALQLWQSSLRAVQPEWERDRPERWDEVWLPWLCLTDVVEEKMVRGPLVKVWNAASQRAVEISAQPGYMPPRPW